MREALAAIIAAATASPTAQALSERLLLNQRVPDPDFHDQLKSASYASETTEVWL